tara:strand:+ start:477 stop:1490 length:1014 start_codon:yes stop_codon:yes gene_type:complete
MKKYKINKISEIKEEQLLDFYKKVYKNRYKNLTNNWRWWYRAGSSSYESLILSTENKVIGQAGLLPIDLNILGKKTSAIWFVDFAILNEFQGKGYGKILTKEWMNICPNQITFCNNLSLRVFKKFGWKNNLSTKRLAKPINVLKFLPILKKFDLKLSSSALRYFNKRKFRQESIIKVYKIDENFKIINDSFKIKKFEKNNNLAEIIRDEAWLHWRLMECPYKKDIYFFEHKNNFAIVHIFVIENIKRLNILYTYSLDEPDEEELFAKITNWSLNNNIDLIWAVQRKKEFKKIFPKVINKSINFASWSSNNKISEILQNGLLDSQGIDSDIDSNLYIE